MMTENVKVFRAGGRHGIGRVERKIEAWVRRRPEVTIIDQATHLTIDVNKSRDGELYQELIVTLLYERGDLRVA